MTNSKSDVQWGLQRARQSGWKVVQPLPNQLQLDLDGARALRRYGMQYSILRRQGLTKGWRERVKESKKRGHVHVVITMPSAVSDLERVALQAVLGSDIKREAFNYCRVKRRNKYPIVLFERSA